MAIPTLLKHVSFNLVLMAGIVFANQLPQELHAQTLRITKPQDLVKLAEKRTFIPPTKSTVKVWTGTGGLGDEFFSFTNEFFVSNQREDLNWWFQWSTEQPGATKAIYQVSLFPFHASDKDWQNPAGLVASGVVPGFQNNGARQHFQIDLASLLPSHSTLQSKPLQRQRLLIQQPGQTDVKPQAKPKLKLKPKASFNKQDPSKPKETFRKRISPLKNPPAKKQGAKPTDKTPDIQLPSRQKKLGIQKKPGVQQQPGLQPAVNRKPAGSLRPAQQQDGFRSRLKPAADRTLRLRKNRLDFLRLLPTDRPQIPTATYYIRIVTLAANDSIVGAPSHAAILHYGKQMESIVNYYEDPNAFQQPPPSQKINNPAFKISEYRSFHDYQPGWPYRFVITKDMNFIGIQYTKGQKVYWPPSSGNDSAWDKVSGAFGSLVDFVANAVNKISNAYASIKSNVLEYAIKFVPGCSQSPKCQSGLSFALDYGLASVGLPPSLPNFDDLKDMGKDYLIQYAAEQSELPIDEATRVINKYMDEVDNVASGGGWYKMDTSFQYSDAMLLIEVWNPTNKPTDPAVLTLKQFHKLFVFPGDGKSKPIPIPTLNPGQRIKVPVMMPPNSMQYTPGASMLQSDWNKLAGQGVTLQVFGDYGDNTPNHAVIVVKQ